MRAISVCLLVLIISFGSASAAPKSTVVFIGSSSISGWKTLQSDFPRVRAINLGTPGRELSEIAFEARQRIAPYDPETVVVYAGENDLHWGASGQAVCDRLVFFLEEVPRVRVVFITIKPSPSRWDRLHEDIRKANTCAKRIAEGNDRLVIADVFSKMMDEFGEPLLELFEDDLLHMNGKGYELWKKTIAPLIEPPL